MKLKQVLVKKGEAIFKCRLDALDKIRCGACRRGLVEPKRRSVCKVCKAVVTQVSST